MRKKVAISRTLFIIICVLAIGGFLVTLSFAVQLYHYSKIPPLLPQTKTDDIIVLHSPLDTTIFKNDFIYKLNHNFALIFYDTVRSYIGDSIMSLPPTRITIQLRTDLLTATIYFDYAYPCNSCPTFPLWRANIIYDPDLDIMSFNDIVYREVTPSQYLTYKDMIVVNDNKNSAEK